MIWYRTLAATAACAVALGASGCSGDPASEPSPSAASSGATNASGEASSTAATVEGFVSGAVVRLEVAPLAAVGDATVLTAKLTVIEQAQAGPLTLGDRFADRTARNQGSTNGFDLSDVRLVAAGAGVLASPARSADGNVVATSLFRAPSLKTGESAGLQVVFGALPAEATSADVLWPLLGAASQLPVEKVASAPTVANFGTEAPRGADPATATEKLVEPLAARWSELGGAVRTAREPTRTTVVLAADLLFAEKSATLSSKAQDALARATAQIRATGPGPIRITGHTDDQGSAAIGQRLSERRARTVATRLATQLPPREYPPTVEGKGERQPAVPGTSNEARAANRRVEIVVERAQSEEPESAADAPSERSGPSAAGDQGLPIRRASGEAFRVRAYRAVHEGDWLRLDLSLSVERFDGKPTDVTVDWRDTTRRTEVSDASGVGVVDQSRIAVAAVTPTGVCACPNVLAGVPFTTVGDAHGMAVYVRAPASLGSTVAIQLPRAGGRLTDVPVQ